MSVPSISVPIPPVIFAKLSELPPGESVIMMGYGAGGSGKTEFLGTGGDRTLIIDTGDGMETLKSTLGFKKRHPDCNPTIVSVREKTVGRGRVDTATAFDIICDVIDYTLAHHADEYDTIAIDDVTAFRHDAMNKGLEIGQKLGKSMTKSKQEAIGATIYAVQDYGAEMDLINKFTAAYSTIFREAKKNFIMMAHERITLVQPKNDKGVPIVGAEMVVKDVRPGFTGKTFPDDIIVYFDEVWHFETVGSGDGVVYRARTSGAEDLTAKTRHGGVFTTIIKNPNVQKMLHHIKSNTQYRE